MTQHIFLSCFLEELELYKDSGSVGEGEGQVSRRVSLPHKVTRYMSKYKRNRLINVM
jgi:hypothetical protein